MFTSLINRSSSPAEWQKIPWHDPDFSRRMLTEHLSQAHDHASRRFAIIDQQVAWIQRKVLGGQPANILDLGCGPGFYAERFVALGHTYTGIDFSPASIAYARDHAPEATFVQGDVRELDYGSEGGGYDLVSMIFGEFNAFSTAEAERIAGKAYAALKSGGKLLLEVHTADFVHRLGREPSSWYTAERGLFADEPYLCLNESRFEADTAISYHYVYTESGAMQQYTNMIHAYTDDEYRRLLRAFERTLFYPSLTGSMDHGDLFVIVAEK